MVRPPCCDKLNVRKGPWTAEEDAKILAYVSKHGTGNWTAVPKKAGLRRCGKSCRLRWTNYLRPDLKHESFTPQEEELIVKLHAAIGSRWSIIAQQLPGRTDNDVKNYWNTRLKKKLTDMGIDPVTHKPFSQILADYGSIGGLPKTGTRIRSVNRDLKNAFVTRSEKYPPAPPAGGFSSSINRHIMTVASPKVEPIEDSFLSRNMTSNHTISNSSNLLCQLQAIKLVTEASNWVKHETVSPTFFHEGSPSSSSSSSSTCSTAGQESPSLAFSWRDFLLDDDLVPANPQPQEQQYQKSLEFTSQAQHVMPNSDHINSEALTTTQMMNNGVKEDCGALSNSLYASSSTNGFLEAILDREHDMFLEFSELLEAPFYN